MAHRFLFSVDINPVNMPKRKTPDDLRRDVETLIVEYLSENGVSRFDAYSHQFDTNASVSVERESENEQTNERQKP